MFGPLKVRLENASTEISAGGVKLNVCSFNP